MSNEVDVGVAASSALVGVVGTLLIELVANGTIDPKRMKERLQEFSEQPDVVNAPHAERDLVHRVIKTMIMGLEIGEREVGNAGK